MPENAFERIYPSDQIMREFHFQNEKLRLNYMCSQKLWNEKIVIVVKSSEVYDLFTYFLFELIWRSLKQPLGLSVKEQKTDSFCAL